MVLTAAERKAMADVLAQLETEAGTLTPDIVVQEAEREDSPLHHCFEWDNEKAGHAHRLEQARTLIRSIRVVVTIEDRTLSTFRYVRDPSVAPDDQGYVSVTVLRNDPVRAELLVRQEFDRADACMQRAEDLAEALQVEGVVARVRKQLATAKRQIEKKTEKKRARREEAVA